MNLGEVADIVLAGHTNESEEAQVWRRFGEPISERVEVFVLAWGCWRNGLDAEAERLYRSAKTKHRVNERVTEPDFQIQLGKDIAYALTWRATLDFGNPSIGRPQLLSEFQNIVSNYPHSQYHERGGKKRLRS